MLLELVILLAIWTFCPVGQPDYVIPMPDYATCARIGPVVIEQVREDQGGATFSCLRFEEDLPDGDCYP